MSLPADNRPPFPHGLPSGIAPAGIGPDKRSVVAGRYELLEHVADGGMGAVYIARHTLSKTKLALKLIHPHLCRGDQNVERFHREVSAAATIEHPGIVQVFDAGIDDDGGFFMAMELLEGESLGDFLRRDWPGMRRTVALMEGVLEPLAKAHERDFIHRDLKPDNIFIATTSEGIERVKLLDFGLAREVHKGGPTQTGTTFGTPEYMSPEQAISARKVRAPGDVWAVGVMLYELLSGIHPFDGETPHAIMANAIKDDLPPLRDHAPHVPKELAAVIERALSKEPLDRPQTAGDMLRELRAVCAQLTLDDTVPNVAFPVGSDPGLPLVSSARLVGASSRALAETVGQPVESSQIDLPRSNRATVVVWTSVAALGVLSLVLLFAFSGDAPSMDSGSTATASSASAVSGRTQAAPDDPEAPSARPSDQPSAAPPSPPATNEAPTAASGAPRVERTEAPSATSAEVGERPTGGQPSAEPAPVRNSPVTSVTDPVPAPTEPEPAPAPTAPAPPPVAPPEERAEPPAARTAERRVRRPATSRGNALEEARQCLANNDHECARGVLMARGRSEAALSMLTDLLRQSGDIGGATRVMNRYLRRFPRGRRADEFRRFVATH